MSRKVELNINASGVGGYYNHLCDRYLLYSILKKPEELGWNKRENIHTASQEAGHIWEWDCLSMLEENNIPCYAEAKKNEKKSAETWKVTDFAEMRKECNVFEGEANVIYADLSEERTIEVLKDPAKYLEGLSDTNVGYIYQSKISRPDSFLEEVLLDCPGKGNFLRSVYEDTNPYIHANWRTCKPDLIRVEMEADGLPLFSVVDIKHAKHPKLEHKVQIAIYTLLLDALLKDYEIPGMVDFQNGYLWNFKREEPIPFDLAIVIPYVKRYFSITLPNAIEKLSKYLKSNESKESNKVDILNNKFPSLPCMQCEWCDNYSHCISWARVHESVTLLPYLSRYAQIYARENHIPLDLEGFRNFLSDEENEKKLEDSCLGWKRALRSKDQILEALSCKNQMEAERENGEELFARPVAKRVCSLTMPVYEDIRLILTAQRDEATDRMFALGIKLYAAKEAFKEDNKEEIFLAKSPDEIDETIRSFMESLYAILKKNSDYNAEHNSFSNQVSVQAYVMDSYEHINIEECLLDELLNGDRTRDADYRAKLLAILFWLMGEHMVTDVEEQSGSMSMNFPLVILTDVIKTLYCVPAYIGYDLETISDALLSSDREKKVYKRLDKYNHQISNVMKSDAINDVWAHRVKDEEKSLDGIRTHIRIRLSTQNSLVGAIRHGNQTALKFWPDKFTLSEYELARNERAAKLLTESRYESLLTFRDIRRIRMEDPEQMAEEGQIAKVRIIGRTYVPKKKTYIRDIGDVPGYRYECEIINAEAYFKKDMFLGLMHRAEDDAAREELLHLSMAQENGKYPLPQFYKNPEDPHIKKLYGIDSFHAYTENGVRMVSFEAFEGLDSDGEEELLEDGTILYIYERFKDVNGEKVETALNVENESESSFLYPDRVYAPVRNVGEEDLASCLTFKPNDHGKDFTDSQKKAFRQLFLKNITLLLGPPGTGKTDFIARAVLTLCRYYLSRNLQISILLSANSHPAINNMLSAIAEKKGTEDTAIGLYKLDRWGDGDGDEVSGVTLVKDFTGFDDVSSRVVYTYDNSSKCVIMGATCWQIQKSIKGYNKYASPEWEFEGFDVVIIDEASQVRTMDAMLMLQSGIGRNDSLDTRYLIVGDEDQLSPILRGSYDATGQPVDLYASIFRLYYDTAVVDHMDYLVPLEEQFRMNEILSRYSAKAIYDVDIEENDGRFGYHAFDFDKKGAFGISNQKLSLSTDDYVTEAEGITPELIGSILDAEYPLIVCRIHSGNAGEKRNAEINLVTELVKNLRTHLFVTGSNHLYRSDDAFWGNSSGDGGLGIISPHHEQINRLKDSIGAHANMDRDSLFIDTVDKLQGRQREAIIVSYGVTDPEKAAGEMEFIYSRNRLNVAITRGKKKTICILSDILLDRSMETLNVDDENILKGIQFMTGLLEYMQSEEEDTKCDNLTDERLGNVKIDVFRKKVND